MVPDAFFGFLFDNMLYPPVSAVEAVNYMMDIPYTTLLQTGHLPMNNTLDTLVNRRLHDVADHDE